MAGVRRRLDVELVRRSLAPSRETAQRLIAGGQVRVDGQEATKPARMVLDSAAVVVTHDDTATFVSRGAHKLLGALAAFEPMGLIPPAGRHCLDAGASTGGFTDVLLRADAASVAAVDVGYGQLAWAIRQDPRVTVMERTNIRSLAPADLPQRPGLIVADLSFISLRIVLPVLVALADPASVPGADLLVMVKPQFEVGRDRLGKGGVVRDPRARADAVWEVARTADELGWGARAVCASPLPGPSGNVEFFLWIRNGPSELHYETVAECVAAAL